MGEALAAVGTLGLAVLALVSTRPGRGPVGALIAVALAWSTAPLLAHLISGRRGTPSERPTRHGSVTVLVRLGQEPDEVARTSILMARRQGPTAIITTTDGDVPADLAELVDVHRAATVEAALSTAVEHTSTDAILVVSARAVPRMSICSDLAGHLEGDIGWVTGRVEPFTELGFAPGIREEIGVQLRAAARSRGLELWEPDATLVRTDLLRDHPLSPGRPWGSWLRARLAEGLQGISTTETLAVRSTPVDAASFWPDTVARQRATAADLAGGVRSGGFTARVLALLLLARELYGLGVLAWLGLPILLGTSGEFPFETAPVESCVVAGLLALLRWSSLRVALGVRPAARNDLLSAIHHLPGSLAAVWSTVTGRVRPLRASIPTRPLVWSALFLTALTGSALLDRDPSEPVSKVAVGTSLAALGLLWTFMLHSLVQRGWRRNSHRVPVRLPVEIEGAEGHSLDCSPSGMSVLDSGGSGTRVGDRVDLLVRLDDGSELAGSATVASRRVGRRGVVVGLSLHLDETTRDAWAAQVFRAVDAGLAEGPTPSSAPSAPSATGRSVLSRAHSASRAHSPRRARGGLFDAITNGVALVTSLALGSVLVLLMLGFDPLVVRSPSMVPTLQPGDVILSERVPAWQVQPGDIVTQPDEYVTGEAMTHRVVHLEERDDELWFETQGDANRSSEIWSVPRQQLVGRQAFTIPWIGSAATGVRTSFGQLVVSLVVLAVAVVSILRPRRSSASRASVAVSVD